MLIAWFHIETKIFSLLGQYAANMQIFKEKYILACFLINKKYFMNKKWRRNADYYDFQPAPQRV